MPLTSTTHSRLSGPARAPGWRLAAAVLVVGALALTAVGTGNAGLPGLWLRTSDMTDDRGEPRGVLLAGGQMLVVSNPPGDQSRVTAEIYDPVTGTWASVATPPTPHGAGFTLTSLADGRALVAGGDQHGVGLSNAAAVFNPSTRTWAAVGAMTRARTAHAATLLPDGRVLVAGTASSNKDDRRTAEVFDPASSRWSATGPLAQGRYGPVIATLGDGRVLVATGETGGSDLVTDPPGILTSAELWNPGTGSWSPTGAMRLGRVDVDPLRLADGRILVAGGFAEGGGSLGATLEVELYDPATGSWAPGAPLPEPRADHRSTLLDCAVLVTGGHAIVNQGRALANSLLYLPTPGTPGAWVATGPLNQGRAGHAAVRLNDGDVVAAGGYDRGLTPTGRLLPLEPNTTFRSAERYTPTPCPGVPTLPTPAPVVTTTSTTQPGGSGPEDSVPSTIKSQSTTTTALGATTTSSTMPRSRPSIPGPPTTASGRPPSERGPVPSLPVDPPAPDPEIQAALGAANPPPPGPPPAPPGGAVATSPIPDAGLPASAGSASAGSASAGSAVSSASPVGGMAPGLPLAGSPVVTPAGLPSSPGPAGATAEQDARKAAAATETRFSMVADSDTAARAGIALGSLLLAGCVLRLGRVSGHRAPRPAAGYAVASTGKPPSKEQP